LLLSYGKPNLAHAVLSGPAEDASIDFAENMRLKGLTVGADGETQAASDADGLAASVSGIQKSIMLRPWDAASWQSLAQVVM
jgi:hypothetical protein